MNVSNKSVRSMVIILYQTSPFHTTVIQSSFIHPVVMVRLHCVWLIIYKIWCYKVVLFDYQGFAPQDFSLVECGTTICTYLEKKGKKNHANEYSTKHHVIKFQTISTTSTARHCHEFNPEKASPMKQPTIIKSYKNQCSM